jgi:hypothetical protein
MPIEEVRSRAAAKKNMETIPPAPPVRNPEPQPSLPPPSDPPRPLDPPIRRLIWLEPRVRRWWLAGFLVLLIFGAYSADRFYARQLEYHLIHDGITVQAKVIAAENHAVQQPVEPGDPVRLEFTFPDPASPEAKSTEPKTEDVTGMLTLPAVVEGFITIHIDPADHTRWTDRNEPTPLLDSLLIGSAGLPLIPLFVLLAWFEASGLLRTWENGLAIVAVIYDRRHSPIAPKSYVLRCSLQNKRQGDLFTVYVPRRSHGLERGDLIWIISPVKKGKHLAVLWMTGASV